jgi:hypothetical protein
MTMLQRHEKTRKRKARYDYTALIEAGRSICPQRHRFLRPDPRRVFASPANTDQLRPLSDACEVTGNFLGLDINLVCAIVSILAILISVNPLYTTRSPSSLIEKYIWCQSNRASTHSPILTTHLQSPDSELT